MYALVSAIGKSLTDGEPWSRIDIGNLSFSQMIGRYSTVYAVLSNPFLPAPVSLNLNDIVATLTNQTQTFSAWLASLGSAALPTSNTIPTLNTRYARYQDGFRAGYSIQPISPLASITSPLPVSDKPDLFLTRANTSYASFFERCMVSVNGFFHLIDTDNASGIWVIDGMRSCIHSRKNKLGILNFQDLGQLTYLPITTSMLYRPRNNLSYANQACLNLGRDLTGYTVMVVIGGYLHVLDTKTVRMVGTDSIMIDFNNYPLFDRYHESKRFIDLSSLPLTPVPNNREAVTVSEMLSDACIEALLTLSQSFVILINNTELWTKHVQVQPARWPGCYVSYTKPLWPMIAGSGKLCEYWSIFEDRQWALLTQDTMKNNYLYRSVDARKQITLTDARDPMHPVALSPACFLQIGCDIDFSSSQTT